MTELLVACVDDVIEGTDGALERVHRGVTLAHPQHPVVRAAPQAFMPMTVHLPAPADAGPTPGAAPAAEVEYLVEQLTAIRDLLAAHGLLAGVDTSVEGWLVRRLTEVLDGPRADPPSRPVAAPRAVRPRKSARPQVGPDAAG